MTQIQDPQAREAIIYLAKLAAMPHALRPTDPRLVINDILYPDSVPKDRHAPLNLPTDRSKILERAFAAEDGACSTGTFPPPDASPQPKGETENTNGHEHEQDAPQGQRVESPREEVKPAGVVLPAEPAGGAAARKEEGAEGADVRVGVRVPAGERDSVKTFDFTLSVVGGRELIPILEASVVARGTFATLGFGRGCIDVDFSIDAISLAEAVSAVLGCIEPLTEKSPPPTDDKPQVLKWGCKWTRKPDGDYDMLSPSGSHYLEIYSDGVVKWCSDDTETNKQMGRYGAEDERRALAALNTCTTPPPDFVDTIPSPPAETGWLPEGMKPPSLTSADDRNEVTEWTGQKYASAWREAIAARDSHWRAHCERITQERDESNQRHARVVEECDRLRAALKAKGGKA